MNSTDEKMQGNSMMMDTQFNADFLRREDEKKECAIKGLIKNQKIVLEEELHDAKLKYADVALEEENWSGKYERKMACKVLEGQIAILSKLEMDFENMLTPITKAMPMSMAV